MLRAFDALDSLLADVSLWSMTPPRIYLLGVLLMAARTFWKTRPLRCTCCDSVVERACTATVNDKTYDLRYAVMFTVSIFWPLAVFVIFASTILRALFSEPSEPE